MESLDEDDPTSDSGEQPEKHSLDEPQNVGEQPEKHSLDEPQNVGGNFDDSSIAEISSQDVISFEEDWEELVKISQHGTVVTSEIVQSSLQVIKTESVVQKETICINNETVSEIENVTSTESYSFDEVTMHRQQSTCKTGIEFPTEINNVSSIHTQKVDTEELIADTMSLDSASCNEKTLTMKTPDFSIENRNLESSEQSRLSLDFDSLMNSVFVPVDVNGEFDELFSDVTSHTLEDQENVPCSNDSASHPTIAEKIEPEGNSTYNTISTETVDMQDGSALHVSANENIQTVVEVNECEDAKDQLISQVSCGETSRQREDLVSNTEIGSPSELSIQNNSFNVFSNLIDDLTNAANFSAERKYTDQSLESNNNSNTVNCETLVKNDVSPLVNKNHLKVISQERSRLSTDFNNTFSDIFQDESSSLDDLYRKAIAETYEEDELDSSNKTELYNNFEDCQINPDDPHLRTELHIYDVHSSQTELGPSIEEYSKSIMIECSSGNAHQNDENLNKKGEETDATKSQSIENNAEVINSADSTSVHPSMECHNSEINNIAASRKISVKDMSKEFDKNTERKTSFGKSNVSRIGDKISENEYHVMHGTRVKRLDRGKMLKHAY